MHLNESRENSSMHPEKSKEPAMFSIGEVVKTNKLPKVGPLEFISKDLVHLSRKFLKRVQ